MSDPLVSDRNYYTMQEVNPILSLQWEYFPSLNCLLNYAKIFL